MRKIYKNDENFKKNPEVFKNEQKLQKKSEIKN